MEENRLKLREKFIKRHEENIEKERKAGIYKPYQTISQRAKRGGSIHMTRNRPFTTQNPNVVRLFLLGFLFVFIPLEFFGLIRVKLNFIFNHI